MTEHHQMKKLWPLSWSLSSARFCFAFLRLLPAFLQIFLISVLDDDWSIWSNESIILDDARVFAHAQSSARCIVLSVWGGVQPTESGSPQKLCSLEAL
jgi:hypothetical protein